MEVDYTWLCLRITPGSAQGLVQSLLGEQLYVVPEMGPGSRTSSNSLSLTYEFSPHTKWKSIMTKFFN